MATLDELRQQLDRVDDQIVRLYEERMALCRQVGELKAQTGKAVLDEERECRKLTDVSSKVHDPSNADGIRQVFMKLMDLSRDSQIKIIDDIKLSCDSKEKSNE